MPGEEDLTAAVAAKLAKVGISANVVAAFYHDHVFDPTEKAERARERGGHPERGV